ncbi:MAG: rRNA methyltransferase, partial [Bacteroidota bacterium]
MNSWPEAFIQRIHQQYPDSASEFLDALNLAPVTSFRLNPLKTPTQLELEGIPWYSGGYYIKDRPSFTLDPWFHAGMYYVQEASSMFVAHALQQVINFEEDLAVLDLCGAPGGKSTLIASLLTADSLLVANEVIRSRAQILSENL